MDDKEEYSVEEINPFSNTKMTDNDLFDDNAYVPQNMIRVKRVKPNKNTEEWRIFNNKEIILILEGSRFTKKEKEFLRTPEGFSFIINGFKSGWRSINKFKVNMVIK